jgi:hypothetical protein
MRQYGLSSRSSRYTLSLLRSIGTVLGSKSAIMRRRRRINNCSSNDFVLEIVRRTDQEPGFKVSLRRRPSCMVRDRG